MRFIVNDVPDLPEDPREALAALITRQREDYAGLSRLIGRNPTYIQQYVKRGSPRILAEADRRVLAGYFGVPEAVLGGPADGRPRGADLVAIPRLDLAASAGSGAIDGDERRLADLQFPLAMLRALGSRSLAALSLVRVRGDSMLPALGDGDDILVDRADGGAPLRDGIYVLQRDETLLVKRVALSPASGRLSITSDNPAYPGWPDCPADAVRIVGRVVWAGRRLG